jgi:pimeloyl-ACP methyl ester carboxylesterase
VALEIVRLAPARIERLALFDTGVHPVAPGEKEKRMALLELGRREGMPALVDAWLLPMVHPDRRNDASFMAPLREMCTAAGIDQFDNQVTALLRRPELRSLLPGIDCPTLVGVGDADEWATPEQHREIADGIPGAELVIFEHAGHMAPYEAPEQVTGAMRRWLERPVLQ